MSYLQSWEQYSKDWVTLSNTIILPSSFIIVSFVLSADRRQFGNTVCENGALDGALISDSSKIARFGTIPKFPSWSSSSIILREYSLVSWFLLPVFCWPPKMNNELCSSSNIIGLVKELDDPEPAICSSLKGFGITPALTFAIFKSFSYIDWSSI